MGKILGFLSADPEKGVGKMARVSFGGATSNVPIRDLVRRDNATKRTAVAKAGDRLGFAISRPWDGTSMEISVVVNREVVEKFEYSPSCWAEKPYSRLLTLYSDSSIVDASKRLEKDAAASEAEPLAPGHNFVNLRWIYICWSSTAKAKNMEISIDALTATGSGWVRTETAVANGEVATWQLKLSAGTGVVRLVLAFLLLTTHSRLEDVCADALFSIV